VYVCNSINRRWMHFSSIFAIFATRPPIHSTEQTYTQLTTLIEGPNLVCDKSVLWVAWSALAPRDCRWSAASRRWMSSASRPITALTLRQKHLSLPINTCHYLRDITSVLKSAHGRHCRHLLELVLLIWSGKTARACHWLSPRYYL
jgi:hypothetical protein